MALRREVDQELQSESRNTYILKELNILDKFRHDATNDAVEEKHEFMILWKSWKLRRAAECT